MRLLRGHARQELQQKRAQKSGDAELGMPKGAREPGEPRPTQEPPLRLGGTTPQICKANNAGEGRAQRLPCPAPLCLPSLTPQGWLWPLWLLTGWWLPSSLHPAEGPWLCGRRPGPAPLPSPHPLWSWTRLHRRCFLTFHLEGRGAPASPLLCEAHCA